MTWPGYWTLGPLPILCKPISPWCKIWCRNWMHRSWQIKKWKFWILCCLDILFEFYAFIRKESSQIYLTNSRLYLCIYLPTILASYLTSFLSPYMTLIINMLFLVTVFAVYSFIDLQFLTTLLCDFLMCDRDPSLLLFHAMISCFSGQIYVLDLTYWRGLNKIQVKSLFCLQVLFRDSNFPFL